MKRGLFLALALTLALTGCTGKPSAAKTPEEYTQSYQEAITAAQGDGSSAFASIVTSPDDDIAQLVFPMLGVTAEDMSAYALSVSPVNVQAYAIALAMPAEGKEDVVRKGFEAFVENQKQSFENYLEDQYTIAKAARVETLEDGTVVLVMAEEQDKLMDSLKKSLME